MPRTENQSSDDTKVSAPDSRLFARRPFRTIPAHALIFTVSLFISFALAFNMHVGSEWFPQVFAPWLAVTLAVRLVVFGLFHQYQGSWRYVSVLDLFAVMRGAFFSTLILVGLWYVGMNFGPLRSLMYATNLAKVPQSVHLLDCAATIAFVCGAKLATRLYFEETRAPSEGRAQRLLIVGAGNAGEALLREINRMSIAQYEPVGFVDDDPGKLGMRIHGVPVLGSVDEIKDIVAKYNVDELAIAMPSATRKQLRRVIEQCQGTNLRFSTIPDLVDIASGKLAVSQMRNVDINDLLGREPVSLDMDQIANFLCDKVILITGAGGSIGSEMCRQVGHFRPRMLVLVEQAENPL
ncbi:MAG: polysaccharide biosynthesis protein, partial [Sedimentisphaerales bacterium]|nr:polysaccharide biosynthesis protein [Sedimentisphaerales bacterium]